MNVVILLMMLTKKPSFKRKLLVKFSKFVGKTIIAIEGNIKTCFETSGFIYTKMIRYDNI